MIRDHALSQAVNLRLHWDGNDVDGMLKQIVNVGSLEEAKDLIIALTMTVNTPVSELMKYTFE